jgi:glucose-6-phosphate isomerase
MLDSPKQVPSLVQSIELARAERVGAHGVAAKDFDAALERTEAALDWLRDGYASGRLPHLKVPEERGDIDAILSAAKRLRDSASDVVFLGVGGSSLGGQTLLQLADHNVPGLYALRDKPRVHFLDNLDPQTFGTFLQKLPLATTKFVAISKSGGTGETLMQTMAVLDALKHAGLEAKVPELLLGLSEPA